MKPTKSESWAYLREVKEAFAKQDKIENFHHFVQLLQDFRSKKIEAAALVHTVKQLFQGHPHLLLRFNAFLPKEHQITSQPRPPPPPLAFREAIDFVNKVKTRFLCESQDDDDDVYESFINIMASHRMISRSSKRKRKANSSSSSSCESSDDNRQATEVNYRKVAALFKDHQDLLQEFTCFLPRLRQEYHSYLEVTTAVKDKDLSCSSNCTPSYCLLPKNYSSTHCASGIEVLESQVLNDRYVQCVTTTTSTSVPKSEYEQSLFRYEDDMYELDMFLETVKSTSKHAEQLLNKINNETFHQIRLEDHFTAMNLRCIERLYDDMGLEVLDVLRKNANVALPVIIARLKQKQQNWETCRSDFNRFWAQQSQTNNNKVSSH